MSAENESNFEKIPGVTSIDIQERRNWMASVFGMFIGAGLTITAYQFSDRTNAYDLNIFKENVKAVSVPMIDTTSKDTFAYKVPAWELAHKKIN